MGFVIPESTSGRAPKKTPAFISAMQNAADDVELTADRAPVRHGGFISGGFVTGNTANDKGDGGAGKPCAGRLPVPGPAAERH